jgi:septal ring factor EnvC (AmiA/AmiB activator)
VRIAQDNATLRSQLSAQLTMLATRNDEKNELQAQVEDLKAELDAVEGELEAERRERQRNRGVGVGGGDREELEKVRLSLSYPPCARQLDRRRLARPLRKPY